MRCGRCRRCRWVVFVVVGVVAIGIVVFWFWGTNGAYYHARGRLRNIGRALSLYDRENGHLPAATTRDNGSGPPRSWRVELFRLLVGRGFVDSPDGMSLVYDPQQAWDDPINLRLQDRWRHYFRYSSAPPRTASSEYATYYKAITGPDTAFDKATMRGLEQLPNDLILVVRVQYSTTHWMAPGDLNVLELTPSDATRQLLSGKNRYAVLFADGKAWVLSRRLAIADLCKFFTISGARRHDREKILGPYEVRRW